jgi:hypothetical protein
MPLKHLRTTQDLVHEGLFNHFEGLRSTFPKVGTKFDAHSLFLSLTHRKNRHRLRTRPKRLEGALAVVATATVGSACTQRAQVCLVTGTMVFRWCFLHGQQQMMAVARDVIQH